MELVSLSLYVGSGVEHAGMYVYVPALAAVRPSSLDTTVTSTKMRDHWTGGCGATLCAVSGPKSDPGALWRGLHRDRRTVRCVLIGFLDVTSKSSYF